MTTLTACLAAAIVLHLLPSLAAAHEGDPPEGAMARTALPDVKMTKDSRSTLVNSLHAMLPMLGHTNWSIPRLMALTGYAFHFEMREAGESVYPDNLDWGLAMHILKPLGQVKVYDANKDSDVDLPALKAEARDAVVASLEKGIPGLVWSPISLEQKGKVHGVCWGLIVDYNKSDETYIIRHPGEELDYPVRFDAIGHTDPVEWFRVGIFGPKDLDDAALHLTTLRNAVDLANGTRYDNPKNPYGFGAHELWQKAFKSDVQLNATLAHTEALGPRRKAAAAYLRELTDIYPDAAKQLEAAAAHYDREVEAITAIFDICVAAAGTETKAFTADLRAEIRNLIAEALKADREAVGKIEAALKILEGS